MSVIDVFCYLPEAFKHFDLKRHVNYTAEFLEYTKGY
jgi:hypothetical protein